MHKLLFVCSGNICRSPMAQVMAEPLLREHGRPAMAMSAGTLGLQGQPAAPHAIAAMKERGLSLESHRSQGVSSILVRGATEIFVMSPQHEDLVLRRDPSAALKLRRLWAYADPALALVEIADPVGQDLAAFQQCRDLIAACLARWLETLRA